MSTAQFRKRTSESMIPESVYKRYDTIVASCTACAKAKPQPARSRVSGIRADHFGDGIFLDHCEVTLFGKKYAVLIILDAAITFGLGLSTTQFRC